MGEVAQLGLNGQQLVQIVQESQTAFIKLVAVFRQLQQGGFPDAVQFLHGPDGGGEGLHALKLRPAVAEHHLLDYKGVEKRFSQIQPLRYPRWLVALMVGLSCACFCKLNKGGWDGAVITFFASTAAMYIRQLLAQRHLHPQINFCLTAFAATTISGLLLQLPTFSNTPTIAMAASVLLLVPGFPLINAVADMFKGHINTGLARWAIASLLTLATCVGVVMALTIWGLRGWV